MRAGWFSVSKRAWKVGRQGGWISNLPPFHLSNLTLMVSNMLKADSHLNVAC